MKKILLIIFLIILNLPNSYGQCLCGKFEIQINFDDLNFSNGNSNYELNFFEKPNFIHYPGGLLKKNAFSKDTLKVVLPTNSGIQKLVIQLKNIVTKSTMNLTITNMTYDNDYFIDFGKYLEGNYLFDWNRINKCQSKNKNTKIVECEGMEFEQLVLLSEKPMSGSFNHNKISVYNSNSFINPNFDKRNKIDNQETIQKLCTINNKEISYDVKFTNFNEILPEILRFYIKENDEKYEIVNLETSGAYIGEIECFKVNNNDFIYIRLDETSGIQYGSYYSIDFINKKAKKVIEDYGNYKIPDSLENYKGFGILKDAENKFHSGLLLRSKKNGDRYILTRTHKLILNENNEFVLKVVDKKLTRGQY